MAARKTPASPKPDKMARDALMVAVRRKAQDGGTMLARVAASIVDKAIAGDIGAAKEIFDRLDGRPAQQGPGESPNNPLHLKHEVIITGVPRAGRDE